MHNPKLEYGPECPCEKSMRVSGTVFIRKTPLGKATFCGEAMPYISYGRSFRRKEK